MACFSSITTDLYHHRYLYVSNTQPSYPQRRIRSFILRQGRYTAAQKDSLEKYWQTFGIEHQNQKLDFIQLFGRKSEVTLEIGFGNGESLLQQAIRFPQMDFIGIEVHGPGVGHLLHRIIKHKLTNIRIIRHDAVEVLTHQIKDNSLARVQIFFPDPWHKRRHHKRRLVQLEFASLVYDRLICGGHLHLATDWHNYAQQMLSVLDNTPGLRNLEGKGNYAGDRGTRTETRFERRGKNLGHGVWDIIYIKQPQDK